MRKNQEVKIDLSYRKPIPKAGTVCKKWRSGAGFGRLNAMRMDSVPQPTETYLLTLVQRQSRMVIEKRIYVCV